MDQMSLSLRLIQRLKKYAYRVAKKSKYLYDRCLRVERTKKRLKLINGGYRGSKQEFQEKVVTYWGKYGVKPERFWYDLFCNGQNAYDPRYIPDSIWFCEILPYFNDMNRKEAYADKGMFSRILVDVKKPDTIVKNIAGYYYNGDGEQLISKLEAIELCAQEEHLIFKPFRGTGGSGIEFYDRNQMSRDELCAMFERYGSGFVAQRIVKQHPDMARLNPSSLNTIRIISFHFMGEVHILSALLRVGGSDARVDNVCAGGSACAIYPDGRLYEQSVTRKSTWTDETANGIKLNTIRVPNYAEIVETAKRLHLELPYFNIIGWDFAVGEDSTPIMVEYNMEPGQNQISCGPTFGDLTEEVLEDVFIKKTLKNAFRR